MTKTVERHCSLWILQHVNTASYLNNRPQVAMCFCKHAPFLNLAFLTVCLDVDIGQVGIELSQIPKQTGIGNGL
jgi:hypothetical protein